MKILALLRNYRTCIKYIPYVTNNGDTNEINLRSTQPFAMLHQPSLSNS